MYHLSDAATLKITRDTTWTHYALQVARRVSDFDHDHDAHRRQAAPAMTGVPGEGGTAGEGFRSIVGMAAER